MRHLAFVVWLCPGSTVVEHLTLNHMIGGSNPDNEKMAKIDNKMITK